jgi:phosphatidylglycerophosphatase GEP4
VIKHSTKKPDGGQEILDMFNYPPAAIIFVGDRLLTDMVFANRNGFFGIHTYKIISEVGDNFAALWVPT